MAIRKSETNPMVLLCLQEMEQAIEQIHCYTKEISFEYFVKNKMLCDAVQHQFEILGEASSHIPYSLQKKNKHIPWAMMYSLRNHIAHEYFDVDYEIIWEIIQNDLTNDLQHLQQVRTNHTPSVQH